MTVLLAEAKNWGEEEQLPKFRPKPIRINGSIAI